MATLDEARAAKRKALERLAGLPQVNGVGLMRVPGGYGLKVNLREEVADGLVPDAVDEVPVRVAVVGALRRRTSRRTRQPA